MNHRGPQRLTEKIHGGFARERIGKGCSTPRCRLTLCAPLWPSVVKGLFQWFPDRIRPIRETTPARVAGPWLAVRLSHLDCAGMTALSRPATRRRPKAAFLLRRGCGGQACRRTPNRLRRSRRDRPTCPPSVQSVQSVAGCLAFRSATPRLRPRRGSGGGSAHRGRTAGPAASTPPPSPAPPPAWPAPRDCSAPPAGRD